jgi:hypothetical protein
VKRIARLAVFIFLLVYLSACGPKLEKLPPKENFPSAFEAQRTLYERGLSPIIVLGTGSMAPYIPEKDENAIVAYAGLDKSSFSELKPGMLVVYKTGSGKNYLHRLGQKTAKGFIVYGINNRKADSEFVTPDNFIGRVAKVHVFPLD